MSEPLVSILIPTYNGERFLRPALRSALDQSYRNIEVLVGDDASTDQTPEILARAAAADDRVRVIRWESNVGPWWNPMQLLEAAEGEYIKYLFHDDILATDCVRDLLRGMQSVPDATLGFSHRSLINEEGRPIPGHEFPKLRDRPGAIDGRELGDLVLESCTNVIGELTTVLFRRGDVEIDQLWRVDGRRLDVITDVQTFLSLLARGSAFYTPRTLSRFRRHPGQNTWNPWFVARGVRDWSRLVDWGSRRGFLQDPDRLRKAHARVLQMAASRVAESVTGPDYGPALEALFLSTARLVELGAGRPVDESQSLGSRAHGPATLDLFTQELEVWTRQHPVALAAPELTPGEMGSTVQALREVLDAGIAKKAVVTVAPGLVERAVPLVEAAIAQGPDVDVELVPSDAPAKLLDGTWLAVAPRGSSWHDGGAAAVWSFAGEASDAT